MVATSGKFLLLTVFVVSMVMSINRYTLPFMVVSLNHLETHW